MGVFVIVYVSFSIPITEHPSETTPNPAGWDGFKTFKIDEIEKKALVSPAMNAAQN